MRLPQREHQAVAELAAKELSNRKIGEILGVGEATVRRDKDANANAPDDAPLDVEVVDNEDAPASNDAPDELPSLEPAA
jgi:hypothetical protein